MATNCLTKNFRNYSRAMETEFRFINVDCNCVFCFALKYGFEIFLNIISNAKSHAS